MSASRMPTFRPRSRRPSARLTAVVDLPTPPLPDATAMMAPTPGGACAGCVPAAGALGCQRNEHRVDPGKAAHRRLRAFAHRLPGGDRRRIDGHGKEHFAAADHDVGENAALGQRPPVGGRDLRKRVNDLFFAQGHPASSKRWAAPYADGFALSWHPSDGLTQAALPAMK